MLRSHTGVHEITHQLRKEAFTFITPLGFKLPMTRAHAKLLGPCFKTGRTDDRLLHREHANESPRRTELTAGTCRTRPPPNASSNQHGPVAIAHTQHPEQTTLPQPGYQTPKGWPQSQAYAAAPSISAHSACKCSMSPRAE
jgi:hypothetical protein